MPNQFWKDMKRLKVLAPLSLMVIVSVLVLASANTKGSSAVEQRYEIPKDNPVELGLVKWNRDYDLALKESEKTNKPLFILFQEVPGCSNCQRFGVDVLSNPLIVDVIENEFVPICIYNNKGGKDKEILEKFNEPSWNNPVVRIIDSNEKELFPRMARFNKTETVNGIRGALKYSKKNIPPYFQSLVEQTNASSVKLEKAVFSMYCFWSGELKLGQIEGVTNTLPGFMGGREVVEVTFNPEKTSYTELIDQANKVNSFDGIFAMDSKQKEIAERIVNNSQIKSTDDFRVDREPKYYMSKTAYKHVPMLPQQRISVNRAIYNRQDPSVYLSPSQVMLANEIVELNLQLPDFSVSDNIVTAWEQVQKVRSKKGL